MAQATEKVIVIDDSDSDDGDKDQAGPSSSSGDVASKNENGETELNGRDGEAINVEKDVSNSNCEVSDVQATELDDTDLDVKKGESDSNGKEAELDSDCKEAESDPDVKKAESDSNGKEVELDPDVKEAKSDPSLDDEVTEEPTTKVGVAESNQVSEAKTSESPDQVSEAKTTESPDQVSEAKTSESPDQVSEAKAAASSDQTTKSPSNSTDEVDIVDTLNFDELAILSDLISMRPTKTAKKRGPICSNNWCMTPATFTPPVHIRDYYNIPTGNSAKLCTKCMDNYYESREKIEQNFMSKGDLLAHRCSAMNDIIILDNESDEEEEATDPELDALIGAAVKKQLEIIDEKVGFKESADRTKAQILEKLDGFCDIVNEQIKKCVSIESELYKSFEEFKSEFKQEKVSLPPLDIPFNPSYAKTVNGSSYAVKSYVPPGPMTRTPPSIGQTAFALKDGDSDGKWVPYRVTAIIYDCNEAGDFVETFSLETTQASKPVKKVVRGEELAYNLTPQEKLIVGSRVLGGLIRQLGNQSQKHLFPGIVAELPNIINKFRYLIFFEDGKAQYCPEDDVKVVYKTTKKPHEYFRGFHSQFIENYLETFPDRSMVRTNNENVVRVELNGYWISAKMSGVDGSLVRIMFLNNSRTEWIYRGSPRLRPIYDKLRVISRKNKYTIPVMHRKTSSTMEIVIDSSDDEESPAAPKNRAVARKSTSMPRPVSNTQQYERRVTRSSVVRRLPPVMLNPNTYRWHKCSIVCVSWVKYADSKTVGVNPLAIPSVFAFKREIDLSSSVIYTAPCGKRLRNIQEVLKYLSETLIPLTLDMFDFDIRTQIFDEFIISPSYIIMEDITCGEEKNPIPCINDLNSEIPDLMNYMTVRRPLEGVNINLDPNFLVCCDCEDNCRDRSKCRCWRLTVDCFKPFNIGEDKRHITKIGYQYQRLDQNLLSGIYECNSECKCNPTTCINRVVQHPLRHKLQLFKTQRKGWGTRCVNDIPQGVFICTYVGNIMTEPSANATGTVNGDEYFAELDHIEVMEESKADFEAQAAKMTDEEEDSADETVQFSSNNAQNRSPSKSYSFRKRKRNSGSSKPSPSKEVVNLDDDSTVQIIVNNSDSEEENDSVRKFYGPNEAVYVMDAKIAGNIGRYFNHSCDPNIFVQNVYVDTHDLRFPWVAFFALRHIPAGSELTWDYGYKIDSVPGKILYCYCGSRNCRKRLL